MSTPDLPTRSPSLVLPFALFGAAAGLFAVLALGAVRLAAREVSPLYPALVTAIAGAAVGAALRDSSDPFRQTDDGATNLARIASFIAIAGAVSGGTVGLLTWGPDGVGRFTVGGGIVGLAFVPSARAVHEAAKRAGRGRLGSLVAATDARTVLSTLLAGVAFAAATPVPAILTMRASTHLSSTLQTGLSFAACAAATFAIVTLQRRDRAARATLDALASRADWLERVGEDDADAPVADGATDLGVGDERWSKGDSGYRASGRSEVLVKGSLTEATNAFDDGARRRHRALLVAASCLTAVTVAALLRGEVL